MVALLFEALFVEGVLVVEEAIHLQEAVLGEEHHFLKAVEEGVEDGQDATRLDFFLAGLLLQGPRVFFDASVFPKENERIKEAGLDLMRQVRRLDFEVGEHGEHLRDLDTLAHFKNVEQARDVLLNVKLDPQGLVGHVLDPPHILHIVVRTVFELGDPLDVVVHICNGVVEHQLRWVL